MGFGTAGQNPGRASFRGKHSSGGSFRGDRGGGRGNNRGRGRGGGRGSRGSGRGHQRDFDFGPPERVEEAGHVLHTCEDQLVLKAKLIDQVPYFNAPIYLENKEQIGKVDEIFGPIKDYYFSVTLAENLKAESFRTDQMVYIDPRKLLPLQRFLPQPPGEKQPAGRGKPRFGTQRGGDRGRSSAKGSFSQRGGNKNFGKKKWTTSGGPPAKKMHL